MSDEKHSCSNILGIRDLRKISFWKSIAAEVVSTAILLIVQCSVPLKWPGNADSGTTVQIALGMGFAVTALIEGFGHFSGAHMNPAVSVSMFVAQKMPLVKVLFYIAAQCLGAIAGSGLVYISTPANATGNFATTTVNPDMTTFQGVVVELYLTFILVFTIFGAVDGKLKDLTMPSVAIGFAVALDIMTGINHTGASMNPARSLGPAVFVNIWKDHWVYWAGPIAGGVLAAVMYQYIFTILSAKDSEPNMSKEQDEFMNDVMRSMSKICEKYCKGEEDMVTFPTADSCTTICTSVDTTVTPL